jgi:glycosyltransferase involved in cell wall biosynthesis
MTARPVIGFVPLDSGSNAYARRMQEILAPCGRLERFELRPAVKRLLRGGWWHFDVVIFNWLENRVVSRATRRVAFAGVLRLAVQVLLIRLVARRIVFVRHNLYPHRTAAGSVALAQKLIDQYERCFDVTFVHSGDASALQAGAGRRHYLPHPLYRRTTPLEPGAVRIRLGLPQRYFVVFGRIVPYKRIEQLMDRFPENHTLVICGEVGDEPYSRMLADRAREHVLYRPGLLSEEEAQALVLGAQGVVVGHAEPNMIVSGTFFYAVSMHRHVFALRTPFLDWIAPRLGERVLTVAPDMDALCERIGAWSGAPLDARDERQLQQEFGDEAIRGALAVAIPAAPALT